MFVGGAVLRAEVVRIEQNRLNTMGSPKMLECERFKTSEGKTVDGGRGPTEMRQD